MPKRYSNGVTNVGSDKTMGQLGTMDPTKYHIFMRDFNRFDPGGWICQRGETWTGNSAYATADPDSYEEISDGRYGELSIVTTPNDNDYTFLQAGDTAKSSAVFGEAFTMQVGKKTWFRCRLKADDVDTCSFKTGLVVMDSTDPIETANADGAWFYSADGATALQFQLYSSSAAQLTRSSLATLSDNTYFTVGFYWDGVDEMQVFYNDRKVASGDGLTPTTTELAVSMGIMNGSAASSELTVDYICAIEER